MRTITTHRGSHAGFTLTEILVTIAIIAVIAGIAIPVVRSGVARSRQAACLVKLRDIGVALESYLQEHNNIMPALQAGRPSKAADVPVLENTLNAYLTNEDAFHCPADGEQFAKSGSSYLWNPTQNGQSKLNLKFFGFEADPTRIPLITDKEAWHPGANGSNILYADYSASREVRFVTSNP